ncbi:hypothetical protein K2X85_16985 [bacterium]|nr:hypothetical protein [bacterium]
MSSLQMLDIVPTEGPLSLWLLRNLVEVTVPVAKSVLSDPQGLLTRVGDMLVWSGANGVQVIGGLEQLSDSQSRIQSVVETIEKASVASSSTLGNLTHLSMWTLGISSFAATAMLWRLESLNRRLKAADKKLDDIKKVLEARNQVPLQTSIQLLKKFEGSGKDRDLGDAHKEAVDATNLYRNLVSQELDQKPPRIDAMHSLGRYYLLALGTQCRSLELLNEPSRVVHLVDAESPTLQSLGQTVFDQVLGQHPQAYLDHQLKADGVTLRLLSEIYQAAQLAKVQTNVESADDANLFEHFRGLGHAEIRSTWRESIKTVRQSMLNRLRYLMACLEEINRVLAIRHRVQQQQKTHMTREQFEQEVEALRQQAQEQSLKIDGAFAYAWV